MPSRFAFSIYQNIRFSIKTRLHSLRATVRRLCHFGRCPASGLLPVPPASASICSSLEPAVIEGFYPVCAPPLTRRRFLTVALGAGLAAAWTAEGAAPRETDPGVRRFIERYAMSPEDPWALVHAIRGVGPGYRLNGESL